MTNTNTTPDDPNLLCSQMIAASNRVEGLPGAGLTQCLCMIAAGLFSVAAAIRDTRKIRIN